MEVEARDRSHGFLKGNFIDRIDPLLMILSFICRAFRDGMVLVHLEKGQKAVRDVHCPTIWGNRILEPCHNFQVILEDTMVFMVVMRCLCSLIMIKSGGRRMADIAIALSPPQVEPWRLKQGTEAMDS